MTFHLEQHEPIDEGLRRIATEQIDFALRDLADPDMPMDRKVHSLRKRCKKLRGLLRLLRPVMGPAFDVDDQRFRDAAHLLARARDQSVHADLADELGNGANGHQEPAPTVSQGTLDDVRERFCTARDAVAAWPFELHGFADIAPGLADTYRKCVDAWAQVRDAPDDANYHRLRKWTKYHWYHVRILERVNKPVLRRRRRRLRKLQLQLGDAHDLALVADAPPTGPPTDARLIEQAIDRKRRLYRRARKRAAALFSRSPDALVADFAAWWVAWR